MIGALIPIDRGNFPGLKEVMEEENLDEKIERERHSIYSPFFIIVSTITYMRLTRAKLQSWLNSWCVLNRCNNFVLPCSPSALCQVVKIVILPWLDSGH